MVGAEVLVAVVLVLTARISARPAAIGMSPLASSAAPVVGRPLRWSFRLCEETFHRGGGPARSVGVTVRFVGTLEGCVDYLEGAVLVVNDFCSLLELGVSLCPSVGRGLRRGFSSPPRATFCREGREADAQGQSWSTR